MQKSWLASFHSLPVHEIVPGMHGRFAHGENITLVWWEIEEGAPLPEHSHPHEQVANILEGTFDLTINGKTQRLEAGAVAFIPPNALHSGTAITDCRILDVFTPLREDYKF